MTDEKIKENAEWFDGLLRESRRDGIEQLIGWMHEAGFYEAPASSRYHLAEPGGLLQHSMNVLECCDSMVAGMDDDLEQAARKKCNSDYYGLCYSSIICCLLHDLCKVGLYEPVEGGYRYNKEIGELGHGSRSVELIERFVKLTPEEEDAIRYHMALWDCDDRKLIGDVYRRNMLAWMLHAADEAATFVEEKD